MTNMVKLGNGSKVTIDEFISWSPAKQAAQLRVWSDSDRARARARGLAKNLTPEILAKISAKLKGKPKSAEHRAKIGEGRKGKMQSDEARAKMSKTKQALFKAGLLKGTQHKGPIMTPKGVYPGVPEFAKAVGTYTNKVYYWMDNCTDLYYYLNK